MKASKLILNIQKMIDLYGDKNVEVYEDGSLDHIPVKRVSYHNIDNYKTGQSEKGFVIRGR